MRIPLCMIAGLMLAALCVPRVDAALIRMADGSQRIGTILDRDSRKLAVLIDSDGIRSVVNIPRSEIYYIVPGGSTDPLTGQFAPADSQIRPIALLSQGDSADNAATQPAGETTIILRGDPAGTRKSPKLQPSSPDFFRQLGRLLSGQSGDLGDSADLPPQNRKIWDTLVAADTAGDKAAALSSMMALATAYEKQPARLHLLAMRYKQMRYSSWMAQTRWDWWSSQPRRTMLDVSKVPEIEKPELVLILRAKTAEAVEPLRGYFPPERAHAAVPASGPTSMASPQPITPAANPLSGITPANAIEVREKALYAAAILGAQLKLEPGMPAIDRLVLAEQSRHVQAVLARANSLLPAAAALKEKAEREKRAAEEKEKAAKLQKK